MLFMRHIPWIIFLSDEVLFPKLFFFHFFPRIVSSFVYCVHLATLPLDPSCDQWHTSAKQLDKVRSSVQGHGRKWSWGPHRDPTPDDSLINMGHSRVELTGCKCHPRFWKHHPLTCLLQEPHIPIHSILFSDLRYHCHLACSRRLIIFSSF